MKKWGIRAAFIMGVFLCFYPFVSSLISKHQQEDTIATYEKAVEKDESEINEMINEANNYNYKLFQSKGGIWETNDLFDDETYNSILDFTGTGIMGSLSIPKINVNLPIYHGTDEEVLSNGVGHLQGTSFPIGGENTHSALSGHRGLPSSKLLVRLDELEEDDYFFIRTGIETLAYKVCKIQVVKPEDTSAIEIQAGGDLVSLITCTPYGLNTHRLIVTGTRVEFEEKTYDSIEESIPSGREILMTFLPFVIIIIIFFLYVRDKTKWERNHMKKIRSNRR